MSIVLIVTKTIENAFDVDFKIMLTVIFKTKIATLLIVFVLTWLGNKSLSQSSSIELIKI
jgi:hypothetical protein